MSFEFTEEKLQHMLRPERQRDLNPEKIAAKLPLKPGQDVADIGCGPGLFDIELARRCAPGALYAMDIVPEMVAAAKKRLKKAGVKNAKLWVSGENEFKLTKASVDGVFLAFVLHHAEDRGAFMRRIAQSLRPGGWLAVLEWKKMPTEDGPPLHERMTQQECITPTERAGLQLVKRPRLNPKQYMLLFEKPARR